jgi:rare lipoprotein A
MPRFGLGHGATASALIGFAVAGLMAVQQLSVGVAFAEALTRDELDVVSALPANTSVSPTPVPTEAPKPKVFQSGIASTYGEGDGFEGNRTACGQIFRTRIVQVAHKSLPCGTLIRIEDADTGRTVDAEVTDRGPYIPGRIVDLSWGAFSQLEPSGPGLLRVNVYLLDE